MHGDDLVPRPFTGSGLSPNHYSGYYRTCSMSILQWQFLGFTVQELIPVYMLQACAASPCTTYWWLTHQKIKLINQSINHKGPKLLCLGVLGQLRTLVMRPVVSISTRIEQTSKNDYFLLPVVCVVLESVLSNKWWCQYRLTDIHSVPYHTMMR